MTVEEFRILTHDKVRETIEANLHTDPAAFALRGGDFPAPLLATQLKYLQRARHKLPSYYNKRCIIPPRAYEQASSERSAALKTYTGTHCLDLTTGLGVDLLHLSRGFAHATGLESDPVLAAVTRYNLQQLGATDIAIRHTSAEAFLSTYTGPHFDLVFADPDRRPAQGQRVAGIRDCQPDILTLLPAIARVARRLLVKLSPLLDLAELARLFPGCERLSVVSIDGEVKEVLIDLPFDTPAPIPRLEVIADRGKARRYLFDWPPTAGTEMPPPTDIAGIFEPDAAFYHARCIPDLLSRHPHTLVLNHPRGFAFAATPLPADLPGRSFAVHDAQPYRPRALRKWLAQQGIDRAHILQRHFPDSAATIRKALGLAEGGTDFLICTTWGREHWLYRATRLS
ncbi:MAG: hypothetical protein OHK0039_00300 [Bacteroidia bacterium]